MLYTLQVSSHQREELVEFTDAVQQQLTESNAEEGVVVLFVQHTTAGLTVNENADPDVPRDMLHLFRTLIPQHGMDFGTAKKIPTHTLKRHWLVRPLPFPLGKESCCWDAGREFFFASLMAHASAR